MAKRAKLKPSRRAARRKTGPKRTAAQRLVKRPRTTARVRKRPASGRKRADAARMRTKSPRLDRVRRTLEETVPTPPSSLDMDRHGSAARTGRKELDEKLKEHNGMTPAITGGDVDADWENAYFSGEEAPGGDNPTPDQDVVDDIGRALGLVYQDSEELKSSEKVIERDKHRWELDPASAEDYKERK